MSEPESPRAWSVSVRRPTMGRSCVPVPGDFDSTSDFQPQIHRLFLRLSVALLCLSTTFQNGPVEPDAQSVKTTFPDRVASKTLPNVVRIHPRVFSGGLPDNEAAFQELASLGVKVIISVDGVQPDAVTAKRHGLEYIHLPIGYGGISETRVMELAKVIHQSDSPVYVHCHHGKHRAAAAAAAASRATGKISAKQALEALDVAGTDKLYHGLFEAVRRTRPVPDTDLDSFAAEFSEAAPVAPMAKAMAAIDRTFGKLQLIEKSNWRAPNDRSDLDPRHEARLLQQQLSELLRTQDMKNRSAPFRHSIAASAQAAKHLEEQLHSWQQKKAEQPPPEISRQLKRISKRCNDCHARFRDTSE